ncbi:MAG: hypothetical protein ACE366_11050 [Bradymonadia bacterium]
MAVSDAGMVDVGLVELDAELELSDAEAPDADDPGMSLCEPERFPELVDIAQPLEGWGLRYASETLPGPSVHEGVCGGTGPESSFRFTPPVAGLWRISTVDPGTRHDTVLYVEDQCTDGVMLGCNDNARGLQSALSLFLEAEQTVYLFVDSEVPGGGEFTLIVSRLPEVEPGELCDVEGVENRCTDGHYCQSRVLMQGNAPPGQGRCVLDVSPIIEDGFATLDGERLAMRLEGTDPGADVVAFEVSVLDDVGIPIRIYPLDDRLSALIDVSAVTLGEVDIFLRWSLWVAPEIAQLGLHVQVSLLDARGNMSPPLLIPLEPQPVSEIGAPCDLNEVDDRCTSDAFCEANPDGAVCVLATAPVLVEGDALDGSGVLVILAEGFDDTLDAEGLMVSFFDDRGMPIMWPDVMGEPQPVEVALEPFSPIVGQRAFRAVTSIRLGGVQTPAAVQLQLYDQFGLTSDPLNVPVRPQPVAEDGEPCDPLWLESRCRFQSRCEVDEEGQGRCVPPPRPEIELLEVYLNGETLALGMIFEARALNPLAGFEVVPLDTEGDLLHLEDGPLVGVGFDRLVMDPQNRLTGEVRVLWPPDPALASAELARVRFFDQSGVFSEPVIQPIQSPRLLMSGDACDPLGALSLCPAPELCLTDEPPRCVLPEPACPEAWEVTDLTPFMDWGDWRVNGDTTGQPALTQGLCGGGAGADVYTFTPPEDGQWRIEVSSPDVFADPVLYVRSLCAFEGPEVELACNDNLSQDDLRSAATIELSAGVPVFIFVDGYFDVGFNQGWQGAYILSVALEQP